MRFVLFNHAGAKLAEKRGGKLQREPLGDALYTTSDLSGEVNPT